MAMTSQVSTRGQITINRVARKQLGVCPGMIAYQRVVNDHLEVYFLPGPHNKSLFGVFAGEARGLEPLTGEQMEEAVREVVAEKYWRLAKPDE